MHGGCWQRYGGKGGESGLRGRGFLDVLGLRELSRWVNSHEGGKAFTFASVSCPLVEGGWCAGVNAMLSGCSRL